MEREVSTPQGLAPAISLSWHCHCPHGDWWWIGQEHREKEKSAFSYSPKDRVLFLAPRLSPLELCRCHTTHIQVSGCIEFRWGMWWWWVGEGDNGKFITYSVIILVWYSSLVCLLLFPSIVLKFIFHIFSPGFIVRLIGRDQMEYAYSVLPRTRIDTNILMFIEIFGMMLKHRAYA